MSQTPSEPAPSSAAEPDEAEPESASSGLPAQREYTASTVAKRYGAWDEIPEGAATSPTCGLLARQPGAARDQARAELGCAGTCDACCAGLANIVGKAAESIARRNRKPG